MSGAQRKATAKHRARLRRRGLVRVEVQVPKADAALIRAAARALRDEPDLAPQVRAGLRRAAAPPPAGLKELLASLPLEGIDLDRPRDLGRPIDIVE